MRYDTPVFFQRIEAGAYNPDTGNYEADAVHEARKWSNVTDSGVETLHLLYGELRQGILTIRLQRPYTESFGRIRIGSRTYKVDFSRGGKIFVASEVQ